MTEFGEPTEFSDPSGASISFDPDQGIAQFNPAPDSEVAPEIDDPGPPPIPDQPVAWPVPPPAPSLGALPYEPGPAGPNQWQSGQPVAADRAPASAPPPASPLGTPTTSFSSTQAPASPPPPASPLPAPPRNPLPWGARVSAEFRDKVIAIAFELGIPPGWLMAAIAFESQETFSPKKRNRTSGAVGLIQFTKTAAKDLKTSQEALAAMTAEEQLDYVAAFLAPYKGRLETIPDLYAAILWPRAVGKPDSTVLFSAPSRAYQQNHELDRNHDGTVTKAEAADAVQRKLEKGSRPNNAY